MPAAAARHFSRRLREKVSDSTVKSIKKVYIDELRKRPRMDNGGEIDMLTPKKRRRNVLVGDDMNMAIAAARGILSKSNRQ